MKKNLLLIIFILSIKFCFSQSLNHPLNISQLNGKKVTAVIENKTVGSTEISSDGQLSQNAPATANGPSKTEKLTWEIAFDSKSAQEIGASKKLKRINFILDRPFGILKYDSENSFESTEGSERLVKKFTDQLGVATTHTSQINDQMFENDGKPASKTDLLWNNNLPVYDGNLYWNGLIFTLPSAVKAEKGANWTSTLTLPNRTVETLFTITDYNAKTLTITLKSKEIVKAAQKGLSAEGAPAGMSLGLTPKQKAFDGTLTIDTSTGLVLSGKFQIETTSELAINGEQAEKKSYSITTLSNSIK